ncbi:isoprenoid biosynthesis protein ElbB [Idiomarina sp. OT37-5b]|jgi:enhancing lycopene biosynthesis protein 2|uniref:Glyoxalase n=1 Tax=Idiomarina aquatica TaxID=1327752 RepID=A0AA94EE01_9GAMM|nr:MULTISPECIES: isoprenoid biosynthesis glyoxalase ElbB [Idiomarina]AVJ56297.1 isoprenoid biosynthesis protein ElbB [Idiomarina sp. OT37-5b]RUO43183.1 isoprenoid biosynthesis protein ElbB [Idiomarina aquatica]
MKRVAVLLSGSGVFDGAEVNEAVLTLLHISKQGASYQCFAPDTQQAQVINHLNGEESNDQRNVLEEAARIARGDVKPLNELDVAEFDALILPGGFGVAKNFCDFAFKGAEMMINEQVEQVGKAFKDAKKPAGYMCIAPVLLPYIYGEGVRVTIGNDADVAAAIGKMGGEHVDCGVRDIVVDEAHRLVTTPAYMLAENLPDAEAGISKLVEKVLYMAS